jgi:hypothetical protein
MEAVSQEAVMQGPEVRRRAIAGAAAVTIRGAALHKMICGSFAGA